MAKHINFQIAIFEVFLLFAIPSGMMALLLPVINTVKDSRGGAQTFDWCPPFAADNGWPIYAKLAFVPLFAIGMGSIPVLVLCGLRKLFPDRLHDRIIWTRPSNLPVADIIESPPEKPKLTSALSLVAASGFATILLLFVATCIRVDRTNRRPVVSWVMITEDWATALSVAAWIITVGAMLLSFVEIEHSQKHQRRFQKTLAVVAVCLGALNLLGSCCFYGLVTED